MFLNRKKWLSGRSIELFLAVNPMTVRRETLRASRPTIRTEWRARRPRHYGKGDSKNMCFSETNPPFFGWETVFIYHGNKGLCQKNLGKIGGFVFQNEPTGGVFLSSFMRL